MTLLASDFSNCDQCYQSVCLSVYHIHELIDKISFAYERPMSPQIVLKFGLQQLTHDSQNFALLI